MASRGTVSQTGMPEGLDKVTSPKLALDSLWAHSPPPASHPEWGGG